MWELELDEKRKKDICVCEDCNFGDLSHFQICPICKSESYHKTKLIYIENEI